MKTAQLAFPLPGRLDATSTPETRGLARDGVRLLVSRAQGNEEARFVDLVHYLHPGDVLVVNESQTLAASLPAVGRHGPFLLNVSTDFGRGTYLVEPRRSFERPGPIELSAGERVLVGRTAVRMLSVFPGVPRLWFVHAEGDLRQEMARIGKPIRYGYLREDPPLSSFQTVFGRVPGSAEMPSAGRPFTRRLLRALERRGVRHYPVLLHTGVSSLELDAAEVERQPMYPEPFEVPATTAHEVNEARALGRRVIAVGTTVVRALESAWDGHGVRPARGFTRYMAVPPKPVSSVDGIVTGFHDARTSHLALLFALAGERRVREAYRIATGAGYLWHEFGDSHLLLCD